MNDKFTYFKSFWDALKLLPDNDRLRIQDAICGHAFEDKEPDLSESQMSYFILIRPNVDKSISNVTNGKKGGCPPKVSIVPKQINNTPPPAPPAPFDDPPSGGIVDRLIKVWNECDHLPECKRLSVNLPNLKEINATVSSFNEPELTSAIQSLDTNWENMKERDEFTPGSFQNFMAKGVDRWVPSADPDSRYKEKETKKQTTNRPKVFIEPIFCKGCGRRLLDNEKTCPLCHPEDYDEMGEPLAKSEATG